MIGLIVTVLEVAFYITVCVYFGIEILYFPAIKNGSGLSLLRPSVSKHAGPHDIFFVGFRAACVATASCAVATRAVTQRVRQRPTAGASARVVTPPHSYPTTRIVGFSSNPIQRNGRKRFSPLATIAWWQAALLQPWPPAARRRGRRSRFARLKSFAKDGLIGLFITKSETDSDFRIYEQTEWNKSRDIIFRIETATSMQEI